ncbi:hypothetical protein [Mesorhizobium sp. M0254]|uniref:hypothetical protein n=1 Tax=Mesorhizobium sp. M0254 TaxID=2956927 RepID=UPI00333ACF89
MCLDAPRKRRPFHDAEQTDRHDAAGLAQIVRTGWFKEVRIKSDDAYVVRALRSARDVLVGPRKIESEIRGLLKTFGGTFGKKVGGFARRADRRGRIGDSARDQADCRGNDRGAIIAKQNAMARLFMTAPGVRRDCAHSRLDL